MNLGKWRWPCLLVGLFLLGGLGNQLITEAAQDKDSKSNKSAVLRVWPGKAPGEKEELPDKVQDPRKGEKRPVVRFTNVTTPTLTVRRPAPEKDTGAAVIVCPGGGYNILAWDLEGTEVADWLNQIGVTAFVLKYRVPRRPGELGVAKGEPLAPLQDAQRAIRLVRARAREWNLDPQRIGILGFSAGGHLAVAASIRFDTKTYEPIDDLEKVSARPDFSVLIYPAYLTDKNGQLRQDLTVTKDTPPMFFAHAGDDPVPADNSVQMYLALKKAKVPAELHVYTSGGHGFGLRPSEHPCVRWPDRCADWLRSRGYLRRTEKSS